MCICKLPLFGAFSLIFGGLLFLIMLLGFWYTHGCKYLGHKFRTKVYIGLKVKDYNSVAYVGEIKEVTCSRCGEVNSREIFKDFDTPFQPMSLSPPNRYALFSQGFLKCQKIRTEEQP